MDIALCYESVLPARGGSETYITALARRLVADGHQVHLYACRWDTALLPPAIHTHRIPEIRGPRFLRPWRFGAACERALAEGRYEQAAGLLREALRLGQRDARSGGLLVYALAKAGQRLLYQDIRNPISSRGTGIDVSSTSC